MAVSIDQQFVEYIVKSLVGHPDDVKIERRIDEKGVLLELSVNPEDLGRVIGKRGSTAQSLRTLLRALGTKNDARYNLKIVDTGPPPAKTTAAATDDMADDTADATTTTEGETVTEEPEQADKTELASDIDVSEDKELPEPEKTPEHSDVVSRTRKELEELDDLDV